MDREKELFEWVRGMYREMRPEDKKDAERFFPELKESEDERIRKEIIEHFLPHKNEPLVKKWIAYLEKQKEQSAEWSEEDEDAIEMAIIALEDMYDYDSPNDTYGGHNLPFNEAAKRLKSLRPQPHWKPSEEQMKAMEEVRTIFHKHHLWDEINPILYDYEELMRDLNKLM